VLAQGLKVPVNGAAAFANETDPASEKSVLLKLSPDPPA